MVPAPARLQAAYRARETDRADAVFRDPYARALVAPVDGALARIIASGDSTEWFHIARTIAFDRLILKHVSAGVDVVVNLAAGLDARPYRLTLPPSLLWVDVDLPEVLEYKAEILSSAAPSCRVRSHDVDLSNPDARRGAFRELARGASRVLVVCEGLLIHLMASDVRALAQDLAAQPAFHHWITDVVSPPMMEALNDASGAIVRESGAPYLFAPREGPAFLERDGWTAIGIRSLLRTALKLERLPVSLRWAALVGDGEAAASRVWAGACVLGKEPLESGVE